MNIAVKDWYSLWSTLVHVIFAGLICVVAFTQKDIENAVVKLSVMIGIQFAGYYSSWG